ncbi:putative ester cyclase [Mycobacterium sp. JS623]|uniref:ester cyclase n=1 Tax=Mycobacterium sp. JS623 TaxID=212767 RepID=UPI0002A59772|nr:ester cyclase [Mycobacterium sp. JS623]AGB23043.1 putative ester cyclase [Mycobacterium sp. JS623]
MSTSEVAANKALFKRFHDAANSGDFDLLAKTIDDLVAADAVVRTPLPIDTNGAEALKQIWAMLLRIYPDIHLTVEDLIGEGDKVVGRTTVTGTHQGEFMGVAPTGKPVTYNEMFMFRVADGRVVETWGVVDVYAQMKQIGVI